MSKVYSVWSEWDIGQEYHVFTSEEKALKWCEENEGLKEVLEEEEGTIQDLIKDGLLGFSKLNLD